MSILSFLHQAQSKLFSRTSLAADLKDAIEAQQRRVITQHLEAIAQEYNAKKEIAQLRYLQSINLASPPEIHENSIQNHSSNL